MFLFADNHLISSISPTLPFVGLDQVGDGRCAWTRTRLRSVAASRNGSILRTMDESPGKTLTCGMSLWEEDGHIPWTDVR